jgi:hypothetical protein
VKVLSILDIFSKRNKKKKDIFSYDKLLSNFRIQVVHILIDSIGKYNPPDIWGEGAIPSNKSWEFIHKQLCREYGYFQLSDKGTTPIEKCVHFIQDSSVEEVLDIIEVSFKLLDKVVRDLDHYDKKRSEIIQNPDDAIFELNERFKEHGIGYQFIEGQIVRVDSEFIYQSAVKPAVNLLFDEEFEGASEEFLSAHEHYKKGRYKEAIVDAQKAFESVMKTICKRMNWEVSENATTRPLINTLFKNNLIPQSLQNQFSSLQNTLESGLPTVRNKNGGHGQGVNPVQLPPHLVAYALHLSATNIVFLIDSYKSLKEG